MSRKRPTEASWDSDDDELLNEDSFSTTSVKVTKDFDDDVDEDALLGSDDEIEVKPAIKVSVPTVRDNKKPAKTNGNVGINKTVKRSFSPIKWEPKEKVEVKEEEFELEDTDEIELLVPDEETEFDSFDDSQQHQTLAEDSYVEPVAEESIAEEPEEVDTTHEQSNLAADSHDDESDESEGDDDEEEKRGGRFKSERQNIVTVTSKSSTVTDIPDTLEISDEQQQQINEFMSQKAGRRRPNQRGGYQHNQQQQNRIQTVTSTNSAVPHLLDIPTAPIPQPQQPPVMPPPPTQYAPGQPRPKIYMNPHFKRRDPSSVTQPAPQFNSPPRSQPPVFRHEPSPPRHHMQQPPPLMDYRPPYSQPPPHHMPPPHHRPPFSGPPPTSQHYQAPYLNNPPRFQHHMEPRPLFNGPPPPHMMQGMYGGQHAPPPSHEHYRPPLHNQPEGPPRHRFHFEGQPRVNAPQNQFNQYQQHEGPGHFGQQGPPIRPNHGPPPRPNQGPPPRPNQPNFQPQARMQQQNRFQQVRAQGRGGPRQQFNPRFQGPRPSLQQQHSKKILQKAREERAKKFGNVQNIPVIGRQTTKRPSTDTDEASPIKTVKTETVESIGLSKEESVEYIKKMEEQKRLRAEILRKKELRRQMDASKRRKELEEKLAKEGKNIDEFESSEGSALEDNVPQQGLTFTENVLQGHPANMGRGQMPNVRGHPGNVGRGQMQNQRGHPMNANRGQMHNQRGQMANMGRGQMQGQRGHPGNMGMGEPQGHMPQRGHAGNMRGQGAHQGTMNVGRGQQNMQGGRGQFQSSGRGQNLNRGQFQQRGRGQNITRGGGNPGNVTEVSPRVVIEPGMSANQQNTGGLINHQNVTQQGDNIQVPAGQANTRVRRMRKIIRTKKNMKGEVISTEIEMIPIDDEEIVPTGTPSQSKVMKPAEQSQRVVVDSGKLTSQEGGTRKVIASSPNRNIVIDGPTDTRSRKVRIDNLSLSTSNQSVRLLCSCIGPLKSFERDGKSAYAVFLDPKKAIEFVQKYNRHMVDLSHISVTGIPE